MKNLSLITLMSFQTLNTFIHLRNTKWDIFEISDDSNATTTFKAQKGNKDNVKIVHVTSVVQPLFMKTTRILFAPRNKNDDFILTGLERHEGE